MCKEHNNMETFGVLGNKTKHTFYRAESNRWRKKTSAILRASAIMKKVIKLPIEPSLSQKTTELFNLSGKQIP